jgi:uracil-DNA glycosylase family 4
MYLSGLNSVGDTCKLYLQNFCGFNRVDSVTSDFEVQVANSVPFIPGHPIAAGSPYGPKPSEVMVIGRFPGDDECASRRNFVGFTGQVWMSVLERLGVNVNDWYATQAIKIPVPNSKVPVDLSRSFAPFLLYEIMVCKPKVIVCFGADPVNMLFGDKAKFTDLGFVITHFNGDFLHYWRKDKKCVTF